VRNQDSALQFDIAMRIPENRDAAWKFVKTHWDQVQAEFTTAMGSYLVDGTGNFCSVEARDDVKSFFAAHPVPAADSALRHALEHIDGCIELRRAQEPNLKNGWRRRGSRRTGAAWKTRKGVEDRAVSHISKARCGAPGMRGLESRFATAGLETGATHSRGVREMQTH
jgi:hypothetical protein